MNRTVAVLWIVAAAVLCWGGAWALVPPPTHPHLSTLSDTTTHALFEDFMRTFDKHYSVDEVATRFSTFKENLDLIDTLNKLEDGTVFGVTKFADMTPREFRQRILMTPRNPDTVERHPSTIPIRPNLPDSFDWREKGAVTGVKDQGTVGTCWAFSAVGNIEGQWFLQGNKIVDLSEQQLGECDYKDCGVFGGWPSRAFQYIIEAGGLTDDATLPYCMGTGETGCYVCMANKNTTYCGPPPYYCDRNCTFKPEMVKVQLKDWHSVDKDTDTIKTALTEQGPLSVCLNAATLQFYHSGIYNPGSCDPSELDHAVLLVGYGEEQGTEFWIIKNSWGSDWGEQGYFRIKIGKCGVETLVTTAVL